MPTIFGLKPNGEYEFIRKSFSNRLKKISVRAF